MIDAEPTEVDVNKYAPLTFSVVINLNSSNQRSTGVDTGDIPEAGVL